MKKPAISPAERYVDELNKHLVTGISTEHTYRPALKAYVERLSKGVLATNEPKRVKCGAPDFIVTRGVVPLGYIEAKDIGESLDKAENSEQLRRYRSSLGNLILTDYVEFRWYVSGVRRLSLRVGKIAANGKIQPSQLELDSVSQLLNGFLAEQAPTIADSRELANRMAALARLIRDSISFALTTEAPSGALHEQLKSFREVLLHDLKPETFADMYAQTIAYGLFAARAHASAGHAFTREHAAYELPKTNPFLRRMFGHVAGPELDERVAWSVDELAELLNRADMKAVLAHFGERVRHEDPVVHFYETFLAEYDPEMRELRGVYYTPEPVVSYIVGSVDKLLKSAFGLRKGLADPAMVQVKSSGAKHTTKAHKVIVLDPATGTGTFLHSVVDLVHDAVGVSSPGLWSSYVSKHLLPRLFGFELLMAPYAVAHMKLGLQLAESGYDFRADERLGVFLTNTLEEAHKMMHLPLFTQWLADEASAANSVKKGAPVMVIIGNPPYSGHSANKGAWITSLLKGEDIQTGSKTASYFSVDGEPLKETQVKWLHDDYVKFVRFAQWRIEQTGYGILGFITNNGYLDNPTFRGMRHSLMQSFNDIYILDLHGNAKKRDVAADGTPDKNVFDIQQGVAISLFVRHGGQVTKPTVRHAELRGAREIFETTRGRGRKLVAGKYHWLSAHDVESTRWKLIAPKAPLFLFSPQGRLGAKEYEKGWLLTDIMPEHTVGIVSARDSLTMHFTPDEVLNTVREFARLPSEEARNRFRLGKDARDWKVSLAQEDILSQPISEKLVTEVLYRPFDVRYTYYSGKSRGFIGQPQSRIMRHMMTAGNIGLCTSRAIETAQGWQHILAAGLPIQHHTLSIKEVNYLFPLYLQPEEQPGAGIQGDFGDLLLQTKARRVNLRTGFTEALESATGLTFSENSERCDLSKRFGPEDVVAYIYATLNSSTYREEYSSLLLRDYPRVPVIDSAAMFQRLIRGGKRLLDLHLMTGHVTPSIKFPMKGSGVVGDVSYEEPKSGRRKGRVWINESQYFSSVSAEAWEYRIGGYRVCEKWLTDRVGRELSFDELSHYFYIVSACEQSVALVAKIDAEVAAAGGWATLLHKK